MTNSPWEELNSVINGVYLILSHVKNAKETIRYPFVATLHVNKTGHDWAITITVPGGDNPLTVSVSKIKLCVGDEQNRTSLPAPSREAHDSTG